MKFEAKLEKFINDNKVFFFLVEDLVAIVAPIPDKEIEFVFGLRERDRDDIAVIDTNWPEPTGSFLEIDWREVEETADLVLGLEHVRPICAGLDWAVCARDSILPWV